MTKRREDRFDTVRALRHAADHAGSRRPHQGNGGGGGGSTPATQKLPAPTNAATTFTLNVRQQTVTWTDPTPTTTVGTIRVVFYGSYDNTLNAAKVQVGAVNAAVGAQTAVFAWPVDVNYPYAYATVQAVSNNYTQYLDSDIVNVTAWVSTGLTGSTGVPVPQLVAGSSSYSTAVNAYGRVSVSWTYQGGDSSLIGSEIITLKGSADSYGPFTTIATARIDSPATTSWTYNFTAAHTWGYLLVEGYALPNATALAGGYGQSNFSVLFQGYTGAAPAPTGLPSLYIRTCTAYATSQGIKMPIDANSGVSGQPDGTATQYAWILKRRMSPATSSDPWLPSAEATSTSEVIHTRGVVFPNGQTTSPAKYIITSDYFIGQNISDVAYFKLWIRAENATSVSRWWEYSASSTGVLFSLTQPVTTSIHASSRVYLDANGYPYFDIKFAPSDSDFRSLATPPTTSMGENDVAYLIRYEFVLNPTTPENWSYLASYYVRTSSSLGTGVTYDSVNNLYSVRIPATGTIAYKPTSSMAAVAQVWTAYIGDGGNDLTESGVKGLAAGANNAKSAWATITKG